jgi:hypothetical protein
MSLNCGHKLACSSPRRYMRMDSHGGMTLTGETEELGEKPVPVSFHPPKNPTWTDPGTKPVLRVERPVSNRLSHSTAMNYCYK